MARNGTTAHVTALPDCDLHKYMLNTPGVPAKYDKRTRTGQWGYVCEECFASDTDGRLGTGYGQELIVGEKPAINVQEAALAAIYAGDMDAAWEAFGDSDPADFF